ncbi:uncharacterized protein LOC130737762 [Lotus japonicus]|uniref:uncharacterized protein LOC130737762 n=1 Tax=Lotus japonicus TaxID=34305 RepID=UPI00258FE718|nr:uncharacterized protein LOC130737762 [Lotus japonicus]
MGSFNVLSRDKSNLTYHLFLFLSPGAFVECSPEGSTVTTHTQENCCFYGSQSITATDILPSLLLDHPLPPFSSVLLQICMSSLMVNSMVYMSHFIPFSFWTWAFKKICAAATSN